MKSTTAQYRTKKWAMFACALGPLLSAGLAGAAEAEAPSAAPQSAASEASPAPPPSAAPQIQGPAPEIARPEEASGEAAPDEADDAPAPKPTRVGSLRLQLRTNQEGVWFHYARVARTNPAFVPSEWKRLCLGECETVLKPGNYRLALSQGAGPPVVARLILEPGQSVELAGAYSRNDAQRMAGWLVLGIAGGGALITGLTGLIWASAEGRFDEYTTALAAAGGLGFAFSLAISIPLIASPDEAVVSIVK